MKKFHVTVRQGKVVLLKVYFRWKYVLPLGIFLFLSITVWTVNEETTIYPYKTQWISESLFMKSYQISYVLLLCHNILEIPLILQLDG